MQATLKRLRGERELGDRGFTLIELLVVVVIIGVLVAIAVPVYLNYTKGAQNKSAQSDVRGAISAVEQFYSENGNVLPDNASSSAAGAAVALASTTVSGTGSITVSSGNTLSYGTDGTTYWVCGANSSGKTVYRYNSGTGGSVQTSTDTTVASCITDKGTK